ncbi:UNVERIFIED_CONTAM: hypothetical protein Sradi_4035700, partial [Sesamum radiatum]
EGHGCMKMELCHLHCTNASSIKNGEIVKVDADMKPFTEAESHFANEKLYLDPNNMQEVLPSRFPISYSSEEVHPKATPIENNNEKLSEMAKDESPINGKHEVKKPPYSGVSICSPIKQKREELAKRSCSVAFQIKKAT